MCASLAGGAGHLSFWGTGPAQPPDGSSPSVRVASVSTASVSTAASAPSGLPWLHSLPGAPTAVFLDFDGQGTNTPYDTDGAPATFGAAEQAVITEAWRHIASYFSMFNTDVTTQPPSVPYSYSIISNSHNGVGYSYSQFPTTNPSAYNPSGDASGRQSGLAHEIGHNFGLAHQGDFDLLGNKTNEYSSGYDRLHGPVMGVDYAQDVHKWFIGHPSHSPSLLQDEVAAIADRINNYSGGDGFRPDDVPNAMGAAHALTAGGNGDQTASGIIERMADVDAYSFTSAGGPVHIDVVPPKPSMLDAKLEVYAADGTLLGAADAATNDQHLTLSLPAGTHYAYVRSHGNYGDLGPYDITARTLPLGWSSQDVGSTGEDGYAGQDASGGADGAGGAFSVGGGGASIAGSSDKFHFAYTRLYGDGTVTARVLSQDNTGSLARAGVMIRGTTAAGSRNAMLAMSPTGRSHFSYRTSDNGQTTAPAGVAAATPYWLQLRRVGNVVTGWRSPDGVAWTQQGAATVSTAPGAPVLIGLAVTAGNDGQLNDARFDEVTIEGDVAVRDPIHALPAPANFTLARAGAAGPGVSGSWDAVEGATEYAVYRSADGAAWTLVTTAAAGVTTFTDLNPPGGARSFYRVSTGSSPWSVRSIVSRPSAPTTGLAVTAWQTDKLILNWRDVSGETGYRIERAPDGTANWSVRATVGVNVPSYTDTSLAADTRYRYRVTAISPFGDSLVAATTGTTRIAAVSGVRITEAVSNRVSLKWNATTGATAYRVRRSNNGTDFTTVATVSGTTHDDRGVQPVKEYYYRIVAINARIESMDGPADSAFVATPPSAAPPAGWQSRDIGTVGGTGATGFAGGGTAGTFTVIASGDDIWDTSDAFRFTHQPLVGDGTITARVASQEDTAGWAKAGVMIRENLTPGSRHAMMVVTPDNGTALQYRTAPGGTSVNNNFAGPEAPYWVRLARRGNVFTASRSADGVNWTVQGTTTIAMGRSALVGLAAVAGDNSELATVTFGNVTLSNVAPTVATAAVATPATVTGVSTGLSVLGADDHGEANLKYTWSATTLPQGASPPTFSQTNTNAAKNVTARFSKAGTYVLQARVADTGGLATVSSVTVVVEPTLTAVLVAPAAPKVAPGATVQLAAAAVDQFGEPMPGEAPAFAWSTSGGSVSESGVYTAPDHPGAYTVVASTGDLGGLAEVTVAVADTTAPTLRSVVSRRFHGARGAMDLPLSLSAAESSATIEPRLGAPVLVFTFDEPLTAEDGRLDASEFLVTNAAFGSAMFDPAGAAFTLTLTDVRDRAAVTVTFAGLVDAAGNAVAGDSDVSVRTLAGDVNGNGVVNELDYLLIRRALFRPVTGENFLADLDLDGTVDAFDLLHARKNAPPRMLG